MNDDAWQAHNGGRWCWCNAAQAAFCTSRGYPIRLIGPRVTDAPRARWEETIEFEGGGVLAFRQWLGPFETSPQFREVIE